MLQCKSLHALLEKAGIRFFTGVPDSLLKPFCAYITHRIPAENHIIAVNEGAAVALAAGHYLASNRPALVYMQNSGFGNAANPLISLADPEVYAIPMLLMIGWRGEPGTKDEPQHIKQGMITPALLEAMGIPYAVLPDNNDELEGPLDTAVAHLLTQSSPFALLVRKNTFADPDIPPVGQVSTAAMSREDALKILVDQLEEYSVVVSTTGKLSRELFEYRRDTASGHHRDFLTVGSMGHASAIALGIAIAQAGRPVYCLDGDGAMLMHMGTMAQIGALKPENYRHILFNNGVHDSVGGQPTIGNDIPFATLAQHAGYRFSQTVADPKNLRASVAAADKGPGPSFIEIKIRPGARPELGRPTNSPADNKHSLMDNLGSSCKN